MFYNYLIFNMVTLSLRILLKYCVSQFKTNSFMHWNLWFRCTETIVSPVGNFSFRRLKLLFPRLETSSFITGNK